MTRTSRLLDRLNLFQRSAFRTYGLALALFVIALALRFAVNDALPTGFPFLTFFPAVIIAAFVSGFGPGLVVAGLSIASAWYFFLPPFGSFRLDGPAAVALGFFVMVLAVQLAAITGLMRALALRDTERRRANELATQRDVLWRELQHRVSNNLQTVSALLRIQSRSVADADARRALSEATERIGVIADLQRKFLDPGQTSATFDEAFVRDVAQKCLIAAGLSDAVTVEVDIEPASFPQETFLPVVLVLTECINNAIEHGLPVDGGGRLDIEALRDPSTGEFRISVRDNGRGVPVGYDPGKATSVGMQVIRAFTRQLSGQFTLKGSAGTCCELRFPLAAA